MNHSFLTPTIQKKQTRAKTFTSLGTIKPRNDNPLGLNKLSKINKSSYALNQREIDRYKIDTSRHLKIGNCYRIHKAYDTKRKQQKIAKIFDLKKAKDNNLENQIETEIRLLTGLKSSKVILKLEKIFVKNNKKMLIFEFFGSVFNFKPDVKIRRDKVAILSQILLALLEINSYGYCVLAFNECCILATESNMCKIFNFDFICRFDSKVQNKKKLLEHYPMPEIQYKIRSTSQTWSFGILMLRIFFETENLDLINWKNVSRGNIKGLKKVLQSHPKFSNNFINLALECFESDFNKRKSIYKIIWEEPLNHYFTNDYELREKMPKILQSKIRRSVTASRRSRLNSTTKFSDLSGDGDSMICEEMNPSIEEAEVLRIPKSSRDMRRRRNNKSIRSFRKITRTLSLIPVGDANLMLSQGKFGKLKKMKTVVERERRRKRTLTRISDEGKKSFGKERMWKRKGEKLPVRKKSKEMRKKSGKEKSKGFFGFLFGIVGCVECNE